MNEYQITFLVLKPPIPGKSWRAKFSGSLTWCRNTAIPLSTLTTGRNRWQLLTVKSGSGSENGVAFRQVLPRASKTCFLFRKSKTFWKTATLFVCSISVQRPAYPCRVIEHFPAAVTVCGQFRTWRGLFDL